MLGFAADPVAVTSLANAAHSFIFSSAFSSLDSISGTFSTYNQPLSAVSLKLASYRVKAMADTLSIPKLESFFCWDLTSLGCGLQDLGFTIVSTGGTASTLESSGVTVTRVEELTSFPEMLDGCVKTLHPNIYGGTFDVVVVNLYPFYDKVSSSSKISFEDGIENIDIGGPAMIRAAAKNHKDVLVVVDSEDYLALLEFLRGTQDDQQFRRRLAWKAFLHVASYDSAVSEWLWKQNGEGTCCIGLTILFRARTNLCFLLTSNAN
ncbi:unnamed protein product [Fraxinus pennsylvanica]|uniref:MGS-like domain-containing protein n=1 Tax=Fraxinus pennsylvanica TaxID=56036 RepID=A0AAD1ZG96_9LAMI|nr:unnamed protein product [Fraxinus pennsylvanica]